MATHSNIVAWRVPWAEDPGGLQSRGSQRVRTTERLTFTFSCLKTVFLQLIWSNRPQKRVIWLFSVTF